MLKLHEVHSVVVNTEQNVSRSKIEEIRGALQLKYCERS